MPETITPKIKFNYEKACKCIPAGIKHEDELYNCLITSSIQGSLTTSQETEFLERFKNSPDNMETQVNMYAALLDDVCRRLKIGVQRIETDTKKAKEATSGLDNSVRAMYAICGFNKVVSFEDTAGRILQSCGGNDSYNDTPLFVAYIQEKLGDEKPTSEKIQKAVDGYLNKLKAKQVLDHQGITGRFIAGLEVELL